MTVWRLLLLHLLPGALATLVFVLLAGSVEVAGYPPLAALLIAIAVVKLAICTWSSASEGWRVMARPNRRMRGSSVTICRRTCSRVAEVSFMNTSGEWFLFPGSGENFARG